MKNLRHRSKNSVCQIKNFKLLGFSYIKFEMLCITSKTHSISRKGVKSRVLSGP